MIIILKESNFTNLDLWSLKKREQRKLSQLSLTLHQPFTDVLKNSCGKIFCKIHRKTPAMVSLSVI